MDGVMQSMQKGRYKLEPAMDEADLLAAQRLRGLAFRAVPNSVSQGVEQARDSAGDCLDADDLDSYCQHILIREVQTGQLVACFRMMVLAQGAEIGSSYSARFYNLAGLRSYQRPMLEIGRFCLHPDCSDPDILRLAWGALARHVDQNRIGMLFGCSSFHGTDTKGYEDAFAMLRERHLAPKRWLPRVKAPEVFRFARSLRLLKPDPRRAMAGMPPLLRSYLLMGGWVSDHAVVDQQMNTLHVFTGLEISAIPPSRASLLRAVSA